jgi:nucleotide-binding universal stress UspA family protein
MEITLVISDSYGDCDGAVRKLLELGRVMSAKTSILAVLEDLYRLEKASLSLGVPLPPDTVPSAKARIEEKLKNSLNQAGGRDTEVRVIAGELREEVGRYVKERKPDLLVFACASAHDVCKVIDEVGVSSLIIK